MPGTGAPLESRRAMPFHSYEKINLQKPTWNTVRMLKARDNLTCVLKPFWGHKVNAFSRKMGACSAITKDLPVKLEINGYFMSSLWTKDTGIQFLCGELQVFIFITRTWYLRAVVPDQINGPFSTAPLCETRYYKQGWRPKSFPFALLQHWYPEGYCCWTMKFHLDILAKSHQWTCVPWACLIAF